MAAHLSFDIWCCVGRSEHENVRDRSDLPIFKFGVGFCPEIIANCPVRGRITENEKSSLAAGPLEIQFDIQRSGGKATFLVLNYSSPERAISDDFRSKANAKFKDWQITLI